MSSATKGIDASRAPQPGSSAAATPSRFPISRSDALTVCCLKHTNPPDDDHINLYNMRFDGISRATALDPLPSKQSQHLTMLKYYTTLDSLSMASPMSFSMFEFKHIDIAHIRCANENRLPPTLRPAARPP